MVKIIWYRLYSVLSLLTLTKILWILLMFTYLSIHLFCCLQLIISLLSLFLWRYVCCSFHDISVFVFVLLPTFARCRKLFRCFLLLLFSVVIVKWIEYVYSCDSHLEVLFFSFSFSFPFPCLYQLLFLFFFLFSKTHE